MRIQKKLKERAERGHRDAVMHEDENSDDEMAAELGIPHLKFELLDPRRIKQEMEENRAKRRGPKLDENLKLKICDLGNGCWTYHHFSTEIQTR